MKNLIFLSLVVFLGLAGCRGQNSNPPPTSGSADSGANLNALPAEAKAAQAKDLLSKYPTGAKIVAELNGQNRYQEPIHISFAATVQIQEANGHNGGRIEQRSDGKYQMILNSGLSPSDLAQAMAHELQHIKMEIDEDDYLQKNPDINSKIGAVHDAIKSNTLSVANPTDVTYFFKLVLFQEVRAYEVNLMLEQEGLPVNNDSLKQMGVGPYVVQNYLQNRGYTLTDNVDDLVTQINSAPSIVDYQKSL